MVQARPLVLTTASAELARYFDVLLHEDHIASDACHVIFSRHIARDPTGLWKYYNLMQERINDILRFVHTVEDPSLDESLKREISVAIKAAQEIFEPASIGVLFPVAKASLVSNKTAFTLKMLSAVEIKYRPLRSLQSGDHEELRDSLNGIILSLKDNNDLPKWAKMGIADKISDCFFVLDHFVVFGTDAALDAFGRLKDYAVGVGSALDPDKKSKSPSLITIAAAIVLVVDVFVVPVNIQQGMQLYKPWFAALHSSAIGLLSPPLKQIEGPKATETSNAPEAL